mgnify:CR=1 FL=1
MLRDTLPVLNIIIRRFKMNYRELKRAKFLLDKILPTFILSMLVVRGKFSLAVKFRKPKIRDSIKK